MDLGPVDRITADAIGEPGSRVFYIQARAGVELVTVVVEKQQVQLLAASVLELLEDAPSAELVTELGTGPAGAPAPEGSAMALEQPIDPRWRAGRLSIGFDQDRDLFLLEVEEFRPDPEDLDEDDPRSMLTAEVGAGPESIRIWASPAQMLALSRHGAEVAARGRPDRAGTPRPRGGRGRDPGRSRSTAGRRAIAGRGAPPAPSWEPPSPARPGPPAHLPGARARRQRAAAPAASPRSR